MVWYNPKDKNRLFLSRVQHKISTNNNVIIRVLDKLNSLYIYISCKEEY
jgi:hypothetical protein